MGEAFVRRTTHGTSHHRVGIAPRDATPTICLVTGAHLCRNPRVIKEAAALSAAGYGVAVLGPRLDPALVEEDAALTRGTQWRHCASVDITQPGPRRATARLVRRVASEAVGRFGIQSPEALGYGVRRTTMMARRLRADLYIGHQELGLAVTDTLAREGRAVGVDLEDWYSEDLLPAARRQRPVALLRRLERTALARGGHVSTTSRALADALAARHAARPPVVLYNAFPWSDRATLDGLRKDRADSSEPSLHWVSQTIGTGRGLETLFTALASVTVPVRLHLRGACSPAEERRLRAQFPAGRGHQLLIHPPVPSSELLSRIAEHDIGLALEPYEPPNKQTTVSNKILHYLLAGLAVVATDTAGQREVAAVTPEGVRLCRSGDASSLASALDALLTSAGALARARQAALSAACNQFCWERQVPVLLRSVERALGTTCEGVWPAS